MGIRLLIVSDDLIWREGLKFLLKQSAHIRDYIECSSRSECLAAFSLKNPDAVIIRYSSNYMCCLETVEHLISKHREARVLMIGEIMNPVTAKILLGIGVRGLAIQIHSGEKLEKIIVRISKGLHYIDEGLEIKIEKLNSTGHASPFTSLSVREFEVFLLTTEGRSTSQIAKHLNISGKTVANHHSSIRDKLQVGNDVELLKLAIRHGIAQA